ncbi:MAG: NINE protein [Chloroflexota bacterium]|nr:NINE protein [Chloroflexota bacterium]
MSSGGQYGAPPPPPYGGAMGGQGGDSYFIQRAGQEEGPFGIDDLRAQAKVNYLNANTMMRAAEGGNWFPAGQLPGVFSSREWTITLLISFFLGVYGIDRFYLGYTALGVLKLVTCGGCFIWWLYDLIMIATGKMTDAQGLPLRRTS